MSGLELNYFGQAEHISRIEEIHFVHPIGDGLDWTLLRFYINRFYAAVS